MKKSIKPKIKYFSVRGYPDIIISGVDLNMALGQLIGKKIADHKILDAKISTSVDTVFYRFVQVKMKLIGSHFPTELTALISVYEKKSKKS